MLGLIEKDLRLSLARKQTLLIFFAAALIMGISVQGAIVIGYLTMLATIVAVGTISYDEFDNGFAFLMTLPFDRKTYVREKYLFSLISAAAAWCVGAIMYCIGSVVRHNASNLTVELPMLLAIIPVMYLSAAIMIPLQLKYGAEKSRIALFLVFGVIAILIRALSGSNTAAELAMTLDGSSPAAVLVILAAVCAMIAFASCLLSIRIMEKREF